MPGVIPGAKDVRRLKAGEVPTKDSAVCDEGETDLRERRRVSVRHFCFGLFAYIYALSFVLYSEIIIVRHLVILLTFTHNRE